MPKKPRVVVSLTIGIISILAPIVASLYIAWTESYTAELAFSLTYAKDVLRRIEETQSQFEQGRQKLAQANFPPCSADDVKLMRQVDFGSSYIKAAGRISHDTLLCTSYGIASPIPLGKPDLVTEQGVSEYFNKNLSPQLPHPLNIFASGGFASIVDPNLAVDVSTEGPDVELAAFAPSDSHRGLIAALGQNFAPGWFDPVPQGTQTSILDNGYLVSRVRSAKWDLSVVAATPQSYIYQRFGHFALIFVPIGVMCGAVLSLSVGLFMRARSFPAELRRAAKNKDFFVEYQPVVDLASRRIVGAEALVRWRSRHADIRPDYFIPQAEECGLIHLITERVIAIVARDLPRFLKIDRNFRVAINVSAADLRDERTIDTLDRLLRTSGARPENIEIEATERAFLQGPGIVEIINALREKGFTIAIDDFGTGYSSLSCLQSLSLDTLKIDRAFVETINTGGATSEVVAHIIEMAHSLNLHLVAEGVETEPQSMYLLKRGVRYAQGWHFGRPMDIDHLCEQIQIGAAASPAWVPLRRKQILAR